MRRIGLSLLPHLRYRARREPLAWCCRCERMLTSGQKGQRLKCLRAGHQVILGRKALRERRKCYS